MAAAERTKVKVKQRLQEKLDNLEVLEHGLCALIRNYVAKTRSEVEEILQVESTNQFLQDYGMVEQQLNHVYNTCELLTTSVEIQLEDDKESVGKEKQYSGSKLFSSTSPLLQPPSASTDHHHHTMVEKHDSHSITTPSPNHHSGVISDNSDPSPYTNTHENQTKVPKVEAIVEKPKNAMDKEPERKDQKCVTELPKEQPTDNDSNNSKSVENSTKSKSKKRKNKSNKEVPAALKKRAENLLHAKDEQYYDKQNNSNQHNNAGVTTSGSPMQSETTLPKEQSLESNPKVVKDSKAAKNSVCDKSKAEIKAIPEHRSEHRQSSQKEPIKSKSQSAKTDKQGAKTDKQGAKYDKQGAKTDNQSAKIDKQGTKTDKQSTKTDKQGAKTDKQGVKTDKQGAKSDKQVKQTRSTESRDCEPKTKGQKIKLHPAQYALSDMSCKPKDKAKSARGSKPIGQTCGLTESSRSEDKNVESNDVKSRSGDKVLKGNESCVNSGSAISIESVPFNAAQDSTDVNDIVQSIDQLTDNNLNTSAESNVAIDQLVPELLLPGKITPVSVCEIVSPWCFFVTQIGGQLPELMDGICGYMRQTGYKMPPVSNPQVGMLCLARFSLDNNYYRAYIMQAHKSSSAICKCHEEY